MDIFERELAGEVIDPQTDPEFYTDFGKNTRIGKGCMIQQGCVFFDRGGITIGDKYKTR